jgi:hypothetical protein
MRSERLYFALGAEERSGPGWSLFYMPSLNALPAANVCLLDPPSRDVEDLSLWIAGIENVFIELGVSHARFYVNVLQQGMDEVMAHRAYSKRTEIVHAHLIESPQVRLCQGGSWKPVLSDNDWITKMALQRGTVSSSDGHGYSEEKWMHLERRKSESGQLQFFVYFENEQAAATIGIMKLVPGLARIKNFMVGPNRRGRGVGRAALAGLFESVLAPEYQSVVNFSIEGSAGQKLYSSMGAKEIGRTYEWIRAFPDIAASGFTIP